MDGRRRKMRHGEFSRHLHHPFTWRHIMRVMGLLLFMMVMFAFWPFVLMQQGGILSVGGVVLFAANVILAYHGGRLALLAQRGIGIPHLLCGSGMIIAAIASVGAFNLSIVWVWKHCCRWTAPP